MGYNIGMAIATVDLKNGEFGELFKWMVKVATHVSGILVDHQQLTIVNMKFCINDVVNFLLFITS